MFDNLTDLLHLGINDTDKEKIFGTRSHDEIRDKLNPITPEELKRAQELPSWDKLVKDYFREGK